MTDLEYQEDIRHTHNTYCKIVIRHAAIDIAYFSASVVKYSFARFPQELSSDNFRSADGCTPMKDTPYAGFAVFTYF